MAAPILWDTMTLQELHQVVVVSSQLSRACTTWLPPSMERVGPVTSEIPTLLHKEFHKLFVLGYETVPLFPVSILSFHVFDIWVAVSGTFPLEFYELFVLGCETVPLFPDILGFHVFDIRDMVSACVPISDNAKVSDASSYLNGQPYEWAKSIFATCMNITMVMILTCQLLPLT